MLLVAGILYETASTHFQLGLLIIGAGTGNYVTVMGGVGIFTGLGHDSSPPVMAAEAVDLSSCHPGVLIHVLPISRVVFQRCVAMSMVGRGRGSMLFAFRNPPQMQGGSMVTSWWLLLLVTTLSGRVRGLAFLSACLLGLASSPAARSPTRAPCSPSSVPESTR